MLAATLDTLITYNPWTLSHSTTLAEAADLLDETGIGHWPIVDEDGEFVGELTTPLLAAALEAGAERPVTVALQRQPHPIPANVSVSSVLTRMIAGSRHLLTVVTSGRVVGTLATLEFLRDLSDATPAGKELAIENIDKAVEMIDAEASLAEAQKMFAEGLPYLVVLQGDFPLAAITPLVLDRLRVRQFIRHQRQASRPDLSLGQWLRGVPTLGPGRTLAEAAGQMVDHQLDALAVTNQAAHLLGVITETHILRALA